MPTPEWVKEASRQKRTRTCEICGASFLVRSTDRVGRTCSRPCLSKYVSNMKAGTKQSAETIAKRVEAIKAVRADPERNAQWNAAARDAIVRWHQDPKNAAAFARRSSERMKRRHQDPEFQKRRDERSSRTMKANWERMRDRFIEAAVERSVRDQELGLGLWSAEAVGRKNEASQWILKKANEALRLETDYNATYAEVQARLRREMPYDGPQDGSEYMDYLQKLGRAVVMSPECREIADSFLSEAIPRFGKAWQERKSRAAQGIEARSDKTPKAA